MAQERIEIKFKPTGHKSLITAIKELDKVTRKLNGQLKNLNKTNVAVSNTQQLVTHRVSANTLAVNANSTAFTRLQSTVALYRNKMLLAAFAIGIVTKGLVRFVKLQGIQEDSERKLALAFGASGAELAEYSKELQKNSVFSDENINVVMAQIGAFGASVEQTKQLTKATIDLSAGLQVDLNTAGLLVAKTIGSTTDALTRYGVGAQGATEQSEKVANIISSVDEIFGDWGERLSRTTAGQLDQTAVAMGDLGERMGQALAPMILAVASALKVFAESVPLFVLKSLVNVLTVLATLWLLNTTRIIGNTIALIANISKHAILTVAIFATTAATLGFASAVRIATAALVSSGWGNILIVFGIAIAGLTPLIKHWIGVMDESQDVLDEWGRKILTASQNIQEFEDSVKDNVASLKDELDILNADNDMMVMAIKLRRDLTAANYGLDDSEVELFNAIQAKKEELRAIAEFEKESLKRQELIQKIIKETATMEQDAGLVRLNTKLALIDAEMAYIQTLLIENDILGESSQKSEEMQAEYQKLEDTFIALSDAVKNWGEDTNDVAMTQVELNEFMIENTAEFFASISEMSQQAAQSRIENIDSVADAEIDALKKTRKFEKMSASQKEKAEKDIRDKANNDKAKARKEANKIMLIDFRLKQALSIKEAVMATSVAYGEALKINPIYAAFIAALGAGQIAVIASQSPPKMAQGGLIGGNLHSQGGTMINAEQGEFVMSRDAVNTIGAENLNRMNRGGGGAMNISFSGNVMSDDFLESEAIPKIKEAIRRGADIGIG